MEFDYNFNKCPICDSEMVSKYFEANCPNRCCYYSFWHDGEEVHVTLFNNDYYDYLLPLRERTHHDIRVRQILESGIEKFLKEISYWRENDRYLMKLLEGDR